MAKRREDRQSAHHFRFFRSGGVDQVLLRNGEDIARLGELDLKLWMALAMPVNGTSIDPATLALLDSDGDGRIRPEELLGAVRLCRSAFRSLDCLLEAGDSIALANLGDANALEAARALLAGLGRKDAAALSPADLAERRKALAEAPAAGEGLLAPEAARDQALAADLAELAKLVGRPDSRGRAGIDRGTWDGFVAAARDFLAWRARGSERAVAPLGAATGAAWSATAAVRDKIEDFFTRCRLAAFDPKAAAAVNLDAETYRALAAGILSHESAELAKLPLAEAAPGRALPLEGALNPAYAVALRAFLESAVKPLIGPRAELSEADWSTLKDGLATFGAWLAARPAAPDLPPELLERLSSDATLASVSALFDEDACVAEERLQLAALEGLLRYRRDLAPILENYVNFAAFYGGRGGAFQSGTLYLDARACSLCVDVLDEGRHASLAALSGAFLAYCELTRPGGARRKIVAAFTNGDSDNLIVGRNGIFVDKEGKDWDATITRLVQNPISVREAFWLPYKKLVRMVEEQVAKRAKAADEKSDQRLSSTAEKVANADKAGEGAPAASAAPARKFDLGAIALVGTALGGISALLAGFLDALFGLGFFLPLGVAGILLLISGPSMILASLKLRKRNLGPILDANGWAINTRARINLPFGSTLTSCASLPPGTLPSMADPFAEKKSPWPRVALILVLALIAAAALAWRFGWVDAALPEAWRWSAVAASFGTPAKP
ncbi:MAG: hypothetical protein JXA15_00710 [Spirochaetales bacterium]|nr:hypothetical protein [Spirochaetales bacterium]